MSPAPNPPKVNPGRALLALLLVSAPAALGAVYAFAAPPTESDASALVGAGTAILVMGTLGRPHLLARLAGVERTPDRPAMAALRTVLAMTMSVVAAVGAARVVAPRLGDDIGGIVPIVAVAAAASIVAAGALQVRSRR
jgi:hypothetical protein